jgi:hypothetical protein
MTHPVTPRLILHCGLHKTGTSHLQTTFFMNRKALAEHGVVYPTLRELGVRLHASDHNAFAERLARASVEHGKLEDALAPLLAIRAETILISAETFGTLFLNPVLRVVLLDAIAALDPHLIYYVRRQDDLKESVFAEVVKGRHAGPIEQETHYQYDLMERFGDLVEWMGRDRVLVRPYTPALWTDGSIVRDFQQHARLARDLKMVEPPPGNNRLHPRPLTHLLSRVAERATKSKLVFLAELCPELFEDSSRALMTPDQRAAFRQEFTESNRAFAALMGIDDIDAFLGLDRGSTEAWKPLPQAFIDFGDRLAAREAQRSTTPT